MKAILILLTSLVLLPLAGSPTLACDREGVTVGLTDFCDPPVSWAPRYDADDARLAILTKDRDAILLLTDEHVALQLSDRALRDVRRKLRDEQNKDEDNVLASAIKTVALSAVRSMLNHSAECPISELRDVQYRNGRLIFISEDGERVFEGLEVNDQDVLQGFSERDARRFVRDFHRIKVRGS